MAWNRECIPFFGVFAPKLTGVALAFHLHSCSCLAHRLGRRAHGALRHRRRCGSPRPTAPSECHGPGGHERPQAVGRRLPSIHASRRRGCVRAPALARRGRSGPGVPGQRTSRTARGRPKWPLTRSRGRSVAGPTDARHRQSMWMGSLPPSTEALEDSERLCENNSGFCQKVRSKPTSLLHRSVQRHRPGGAQLLKKRGKC